MTNCLIVDDSPTVRKLIRRIVNEWNFECFEAEDGQKALDTCLLKMPDIIFLDWNMPVMTGIEFLTELRNSPNGRHPKVLFCTTENGFEFIQRGMSAGADEYIMKPFDRTLLAAKLEILGFVDAYA
jgi:two-component system chemotaxis response regulator CheY